MLACADLLWFLVRSRGLEFGGASSASPGLPWALTYLAHRQAGLYLASPLLCCPEESRLTFTIVGPPGSSQGRPGKKQGQPLGHPGHRSRGTSEKHSLPSSHRGAALRRNAHLPASSPAERESLRLREPRWVGREKGAPHCLCVRPCSPGCPASCCFKCPAWASSYLLSWALRAAFPVHASLDLQPQGPATPWPHAQNSELPPNEPITWLGGMWVQTPWVPRLQCLWERSRTRPGEEKGLRCQAWEVSRDRKEARPGFPTLG